MKTKTIATVLLIAVIVFLMMPTFALAQTSTARVPPPACWPSQVGGSGSKAVRVTSDYGQAILWWCGQEKTGIISSWNYTLVIPDKLPSDLRGALALMWEANMSSEAVDPVERLLLEQDGIIALQAVRPAELRWEVALNGTVPTRPVYAYLERTGPDGKPQPYVAATALRVNIHTSAGSPTACDCARTRFNATATSTYCAVPAAELAPVQSVSTVARPVAVCRML